MPVSDKPDSTVLLVCSKSFLEKLSWNETSYSSTILRFILFYRLLWEDNVDMAIQFDEIIWELEIPEEQAIAKLEELFFPFKKVKVSEIKFLDFS